MKLTTLRHHWSLAAAVVMPLWLGWSLSTIAGLEGRELRDADDAADRVLAQIQPRLDAAAPGQALVVSLSGNRCTCVEPERIRAWEAAVAGAPARHLTIDLPDAPFSTLVFDDRRRLTFAGSPASQGCGEGARVLLAKALSTAAAAPVSLPCYC